MNAPETDKRSKIRHFIRSSNSIDSKFELDDRVPRSMAVEKVYLEHPLTNERR